jgi:hypothetical protein
VGLAVEARPVKYDPESSVTYDYAILKLKAGESERAKTRGFEPPVLDLGDVELHAKPVFYILHHPKGEPPTLPPTHCKAIDADPPTSSGGLYEIGQSSS